jgi:putative glutamine amidotransferase
MADAPVIAVAWPKDDYVSAVRAAGGEPRVLTPDHDPLPEALDRCDGVLLTGGADVDPTRYGESKRHATLTVEPARDAYELALVDAAFERRLPILAICRGIQLLNVARGGTLYQDLPDQAPSAVNHRIKEPSDAMAHDVAIAPDTRLSTLLDGAPTVAVNSRHHQAVRDAAPGFIISATAPDGIVEGIELPGEAFCVAVQWHPENFWRSGRFLSLFEGLIAAAREHVKARG